MSWRCYGPPRETPAQREERRRLVRECWKSSLNIREFRRCVALKGWRTRRAKEKEDAPTD